MLLFTLWPTVFSYPPHSSIVSGVLSPDQILSVHKRAPLWFALGLASLGAGSHSQRMCLSPFHSWIPLVCWKHKSKRTVCLPRECVCAKHIAQHSAAVRGKSQHLPTHRASSQLSPARLPLPITAAMGFPTTVKRLFWKRMQHGISYLIKEFVCTLAEDEKYWHNQPQGIESYRVK